MTIEEWAKDFKSYVTLLDMPRDDYKGIMGYIEDAIAMLNEQEERIGVLTRAIEQMPKPTKLLDVFGDGYAKVVRCKDCKYAYLTDDGECKYCEMEKDDNGFLIERYRSWDWFCSDGEKGDKSD